MAETQVVTQPIPRLPGLPLVGNLREFRADRLGLWLRVARTCGDVGAYRLFGRDVILLSAPELAQAVLVRHADAFEKPPYFRALTRPVLGNGLLTSENAFHHRQRQLVAPAFQHRRVAAYAAVMAEYAERIAAGWPDGATIDIAHEMMRLTLWIVGATLFDADVLGEAEDLGRALSVALQRFNKQVSSLVPLPQSWPTPGNRRARRAIERLDATIYRLIAERRAAPGDRGDLLSMLLAAHDADDGTLMSDSQVHDEAMTIFLAGHETTANALAWTWYLLALHEQVAERLAGELDGVLAGRTPSYDDLPRLPYTLQVLKESMRLYPPAHVIGRYATQMVDLGPVQILAGSLVMISPYVLHRRADSFAEPERFDPERWLPEREARLPRGAYLPFGGGPRVCIGNHFAMMEGHIVLAALAQRVKFALAPQGPIVPRPVITLRPRDGIKMTVMRHAL
jgi:cytochrome P450